MKENLDREYDVLVSDFNEDEKPEKIQKTEDVAVEKPTDVTAEPSKWSTRVIGSAEVVNPRAIEASFFYKMINAILKFSMLSL